MTIPECPVRSSASAAPEECGWGAATNSVVGPPVIVELHETLGAAREAASPEGHA